MSDAVVLFQGTVTKVEADTVGYGDTMRVVGVAVTVSFGRVDSYGSFNQTTVIHVPTKTEHPMIGDELAITVTRLRPEPEPDFDAEVAETKAEALSRDDGYQEAEAEPGVDAAGGVTIDELEQAS